MNRWNQNQIESIKLATEEMRLVVIPVNLLEALLQVCDWHLSSVDGQRSGETAESHPDWDAVEYLEAETRKIQLQASAYLPDDNSFIENPTLPGLELA